jgi:hypothetical protein
MTRVKEGYLMTSRDFIISKFFGFIKTKDVTILERIVNEFSFNKKELFEEGDPWVLTMVMYAIKTLSYNNPKRIFDFENYVRFGWQTEIALTRVFRVLKDLGKLNSVKFSQLLDFHKTDFIIDEVPIQLKNSKFGSYFELGDVKIMDNGKIYTDTGIYLYIQRFLPAPLLLQLLHDVLVKATGESSLLELTPEEKLLVKEAWGF